MTQYNIADTSNNYKVQRLSDGSYAVAYGEADHGYGYWLYQSEAGSNIWLYYNAYVYSSLREQIEGMFQEPDERSYLVFYFDNSCKNIVDRSLVKFTPVNGTPMLVNTPWHLYDRSRRIVHLNERYTWVGGGERFVVTSSRFLFSKQGGGFGHLCVQSNGLVIRNIPLSTRRGKLLKLVTALTKSDFSDPELCSLADEAELVSGDVAFEYEW